MFSISHRSIYSCLSLQSDHECNDAALYYGMVIIHSKQVVLSLISCSQALLGLAAIRHETTELIVKNPQGMEGKGAVLALHSIAVGALIALLGGPILMRLAL